MIKLNWVESVLLVMFVILLFRMMYKWGSVNER
jgi:hypothetical protein